MDLTQEWTRHWQWLEKLNALLATITTPVVSCRVTGLDATPLLLQRARQDAHTRGVEVDYVPGDMRRLPWVDRFDRVINWFTSFGYFDDPDNRRVLAECVRALRPGGRLALELMHYACCCVTTSRPR